MFNQTMQFLFLASEFLAGIAVIMGFVLLVLCKHLIKDEDDHRFNQEMVMVATKTIMMICGFIIVFNTLQNIQDQVLRAFAATSLSSLVFFILDYLSTMISLRFFRSSQPMATLDVSQYNF